MKKLHILSLSICSILFASGTYAASATKHVFTTDDMWAMQRVGDAVVSPDGKRIVFDVKTFDVKANKGSTDIWTANADGSARKVLVQNHTGDHSGVFSSDGKKVLFLSSRSGSSQVWEIPANGGVAWQVTSLPVGVNGFKIFPDGKTLLISMDVYPDAVTLQDTVKQDEINSTRQGNYKKYDQLLFRHWDTFDDGKRAHLFVFKNNQNVKDLMQGLDMDAPTLPFGGMEETDISHDGQYVIFTARSDGAKAAWSNNVDLFMVPADGSEKPRNMTSSNLAWDSTPVFSPDGKTLAYLSMARPGFESDRIRITLMDWASKKTNVLTEKWDRSAGEIVWSLDGKTIYTSADHIGNHAIFSIDVASQKVTTLVEKGYNGHPSVAGDRLVFHKDTLILPTELFSMRTDGSDVKQITAFNTARAGTIQWGEYEQFSFPGHRGEKVHGYIVKPANWDGTSKVPVAFLIHGGPQGSFGDHFHYRWNPQAFAAQGYATIFIDFHGSTGYGQKFVDSISGNWGAAPYEDLMKGLDFAFKQYSFLDSKRLFGLGASYGGFMINWINGHTDRFKALVCHDGNLDEQMAYFNTEELWFPEWEHQGLPWENPNGYQKYNPVNFVKNWKTPVLVIHGGKDFRVVDTQGMGTFTALQRKGIKSRFLYFPEENHWILKPQDSFVWHREIFAWMKEFQ